MLCVFFCPFVFFAGFSRCLLMLIYIQSHGILMVTYLVCLDAKKKNVMFAC